MKLNNGRFFLFIVLLSLAVVVGGKFLMEEPTTFDLFNEKRGIFGTKSKCFPIRGKKCKEFTVQGVTKLFCVYFIAKEKCWALDDEKMAK